MASVQAKSWGPKGPQWKKRKVVGEEGSKKNIRRGFMWEWEKRPLEWLQEIEAYRCLKKIILACVKGKLESES